MAWHAKSTGGYHYTSSEAYDNCYQIYGILNSLGWTLEAICGVLGNMNSESGYNPWRWQYEEVLSVDDSVAWDPSASDTKHAYGLCQWDGPGKYIVNGQGYQGYAPNFSDQAGSASDGRAQVYFLDGYSAQWQDHPSSAWPETFSEYKQLTDVTHAVESFFHNYEIGTWDPDRITIGQYWYNEFGGVTPPSPGLKDDILFLKHFIDKNRKAL